MYEKRKKERGLLQHLSYCFWKVVSGILPNKKAGCYAYAVPKVVVLLYEHFTATE